MSEPSHPPESELLDHSGNSQADDALLLRLLLAFSDGRVEDFADALPPPTGIRRFIRRASVSQDTGRITWSGGWCNARGRWTMREYGPAAWLGKAIWEISV